MMLDDDELNQIEESKRSRIEQLNATGKKSECICEPGQHQPTINDLGSFQCLRCFMHFSPKALWEELQISEAWNKRAELRYKDMLKMKKKVIAGKATKKDRISVEGFRYVLGRGYIEVNREFYDPD